MAAGRRAQRGRRLGCPALRHALHLLAGPTRPPIPAALLLTLGAQTIFASFSERAGNAAALGDGSIFFKRAVK